MASTHVPSAASSPRTVRHWRMKAAWVWATVILIGLGFVMWGLNGGASAVPGLSRAGVAEAAPAAAAAAGAPAPSWLAAAAPPPRPAWCAALERDPRPADRVCSPRSPDGCPKGVTPRFFSQFGQDAWLYTHHFRHLRRPGVFVDLAANDAISISNTYFLERCLGWSGLCIEPNAAYHGRIIELRTCELVPMCVANHTRTVEFIEAGGLSGIAETNKNLVVKHKWQAGVPTAPRRKVPCARLAQLLRRRGLTHVDFLSLDIEGAEPEALESVDWDSVQIDVISLEEEDDDQRATKFLTAKGYKVVQYNQNRPQEVFLFHPSVEVGKPTA